MNAHGGVNMEFKSARLATYTNWPVSYLEPERMAASGFYYLNRGDEVRCAFCKVEIMRWLEGDDPAVDHKRLAPQCPFINGAVSDREENELLTQPVHPKYATEVARLRTFAEWPRGLKQQPDKLAEAGFYYTGQGDKTKCFYCDGGLKDWEADDEPWKLHARWFDRCPYVLLVKGRDYVQKIVTESCTISNNDERVEQEAIERQPDLNERQFTENNICKICYNAEKNVCFVPCGHVMACGKCASAVTNCPTCRTTIKTAVRMYY
ncbi:inhibitor of apoptosis protein 3 [Spilosoma obliqua nucleopolyhedrosis virus]|nr:inhibitor of apoptosis protein 3 [Spilosoma obliqua nucleopolyhedrosis virus]